MDDGNERFEIINKNDAEDSPKKVTSPKKIVDKTEKVDMGNISFIIPKEKLSTNVKTEGISSNSSESNTSDNKTTTNVTSVQLDVKNGTSNSSNSSNSNSNSNSNSANLEQTTSHPLSANSATMSTTQSTQPTQPAQPTPNINDMSPTELINHYKTLCIKTKKVAVCLDNENKELQNEKQKLLNKINLLSENLKACGIGIH